MPPRVRAKPPQWVAHLELPAWPRSVSGEIPEVTAKAAEEKPSTVGTEAATYATWDPDLNKIQRLKPGSRKKKEIWTSMSDSSICEGVGCIKKLSKSVQIRQILWESV